MNNVILTICDNNRMYCERLQEYLRNNLKLSFDIHAFTDMEKLLEFSEHQEVSLLLVTESALYNTHRDERYGHFENIIILDEETGEFPLGEKTLFPGAHIKHLSKYIPAAQIAGGVLEFCTSKSDAFLGLSMKDSAKEGKVLGFFTPLSRSGQTTMTVKMGEYLSRRHKTIMLSFESFSALPSIFETESEEDITDLMYYAECEREKFCLYLEKIKKSKNGLDYVSPARTAMQVKEISAGKVKELIDLLIRQAGYEYVLLDLKEYPDGFFDILGLCNVVYTIMRNNSADHYRIDKYNHVLMENGYEKVITGTIKFLMPDVREESSFNRFLEALIAEGQEVECLGA